MLLAARPAEKGYDRFGMDTDRPDRPFRRSSVGWLRPTP